MDLDDFRSILDTAGVDVWTFIDTAILVASLDYGQELKQRRDKIVERLYATSFLKRCRNCEFSERDVKTAQVKEDYSDEGKGGGGERSSSTPQSVNVEEELDPYGGLFDDEQKKILEIKERLEDINQSESSLVNLLQSLADMDITFQALQETDIGRHVNWLRKHSSNDVRRLVKHLVRKWKDIVDKWVNVNQPGDHEPSGLMADGDSPQKSLLENGHQQVLDFAHSTNSRSGSFGSDINNSELEKKPKAMAPPRKETGPKPTHSSPAPQMGQRQREPKESNFDSERLDSARKRLQANYKEAENAKKQRTVQVMDIHEIPKPKNAFFSKNKGGGSQGRHF